MDASLSEAIDFSQQCFHCAQSLTEGEVETRAINGQSLQFCCNGCATVCESIHNAGLSGFYSRRLEQDVLAPPPELPAELAFYDIDDVQESFVSGLGQQREINLLVEGIHCAACVWLIENRLKRLAGVLDARVNLTGRQLHVRWDNDQLALSSLIKALGQMGYSAVPYDPEAAEGSLKRHNRDLLYRMAVAGFAMMNLMWISIALYTGADRGEFRTMFYWVGFCLATPTLIYSGQPFFKGAWRGLKQRRPSMDLPIALGATITYLYSCYVTFAGTFSSRDVVGEVYFDTVVNFLFVILVGRFLEAISKRQAVASTQRLLDLQPKVAWRIEAGEEKAVPIRALQTGDQVLVKPGERIPVDGYVVTGSSRVDESMLTGESELLQKKAGDSVCAGTMNSNGSLYIEVTQLLGNTALGRIIHLVEAAQASKAPIQNLADRLVPWFVVITLSLASITFAWWFQQGFELALMAATAVLIITCPCAFGLATPMSVAVASGLGARHGILIKNGEVLERLSNINHYVFDKTGTLTEGQLSVAVLHTAQQQWLSGETLAADTAELLSVISAIESHSEHPIARAINRLADEQLTPAEKITVTEFENQPGKGIQAQVNGQQWLIGTARWLAEQGVENLALFDQAAADLDEQGRSSIRCARAGQAVAMLGFADQLRPHAKALIASLKAEGMQVTLLSGDRQQTAEHVAAQLGGMQVIAEVLPEDKDSVIAQLQASGQRVLMIGDGVNDAPALVRADVGMALGSGTDASIASADIVLMSSELDKVQQATQLAQCTLRTIRQNIALSISYNVIMVPLAMMTLVTPLVAAITMPISSLLVIGNAMRIGRVFKK